MDEYVIYDSEDELWFSYSEGLKMLWTRDYYECRFTLRHYNSMKITKVINAILMYGMESGDICFEKLRLGSYVIVPLRKIPRVPDFSCGIELTGYVNDRFLK